MKKKLIILAGIMAIIVIGIFSAAHYIDKDTNKPADGDRTIRVVTSFYPAYVLTINLTDGISGIEVDSLTDFSAGCLHDYQLTTNDMKLLSDADVFIINGGGMEEYLGDVLDSYPELKIINLSEGITMLESQTHEGEDNPHVWLDPKLYMLQVENAKEGLINYIKDKGNKIDANEAAKMISSNAGSYLEKVSKIAEDMKDILDSVKAMVESRNISNKVVVFHDSFAYLSNRAGLEVVYTIELDEDTPLSAGEVAEVINAIRKDNIRYLFTEEQYDDTISNRIENETDAGVYVIDSAVTGDADKDSYLKAMRRNIATLREAFGEE
jgi:zinc transport system substrate-binding protein